MSAPYLMWQRSDGGITLTHLAPKGRRSGESEAQWIARAAARAAGTNPRLAGAIRLPERSWADLPPDRRFRDCWRVGSGGAIRVAMPLARAQRLAEIRARRDELLAASDGMMLRAQERGDTAEIERLRAARETLRALPATVDLEAVTTPEALAAMEPEWPELD